MAFRPEAVPIINMVHCSSIFHCRCFRLDRPRHGSNGHAMEVKAVVVVVVGGGGVGLNYNAAG